MYYRRAKGDMIEGYKYTHDLYKVKSLLHVVNSVSQTRGHEYKLKKQYCGSELRGNFFSQRVIDSWNKLPAHVVQVLTINSFKATLGKIWQPVMYTTELEPN